ncbi:hypothetical protein BKA70DRAFT_745630 [Coprinopsis sp. MPI-PUGE-AT-0042]|nr:hypothetical protein BKA70DRAFT_745630 [Coprinopsis sp. MPI-PUGE-AT-0042]
MIKTSASRTLLSKVIPIMHRQPPCSTLLPAMILGVRRRLTLKLLKMRLPQLPIASPQHPPPQGQDAANAPERRSTIRTFFNRMSVAGAPRGLAHNRDGSAASAVSSNQSHIRSPSAASGTGVTPTTSRHRTTPSSGSFFRTLSRQKSQSTLHSGNGSRLNSPSMISLNSISSPLTHTASRTEFAYPKSGPTPEQLKMISSRESIGRFAVPYGADAIAYASSSRLELSSPPPDFEAALRSGSPLGNRNASSTSLHNRNDSAGNGRRPASPSPLAQVSEGHGNTSLGQTASRTMDTQEATNPVESQAQESLQPTHVLPEQSIASKYRALPYDADTAKSNRAKRPVIYAGNGVLSSPMGPKFLAELSEKGNIPVTTTLQGLGAFDETDEKSLHMLGMHGSAYANLAMQNADVIIALGARFDDRVIGKPSTFAPAATAAAREGRGGIIHFEVQPKNVNKTIEAQVPVLGDVVSSLATLLPQVEKASRKEWFSTIQRWKKDYPFTFEPSKKGEQIKPQEVVEELEKQTKKMKDEVIVATGVGQHQMWAAQFYPSSLLTSLLSPSSFYHGQTPRLLPLVVCTAGRRRNCLQGPRFSASLSRQESQ